MTNTIFLRPITAIYFGKPGSFCAGETHTGTSWFPPPISAFQGMIRTKILQHIGVFSPKNKVEELVGTKESLPKDWSLKGPFPTSYSNNKELTLWFPIPSFLFLPLESDSCCPVRAKLLLDKQYPYLLDIDSDIDKKYSGLLPAGAPNIACTKPLSGWISSHNLLWALKGDNADISWDIHGCSLSLPPFVSWETKPGLARKKEKDDRHNIKKITGRAQEGMLYFLNYLRFSDNSGIIGWLSVPDGSTDPNALKQGPIVAGKKGGVMAFDDFKGYQIDKNWEKIENGEFLDVSSETKATKPVSVLVWIILLTPGRWESTSELTQMLRSCTKDVDVAVKSIISLEPISLGGFSMADKRPMPATSWYPAGTSILVKLEGENAQQILSCLRELNNKTILASDKDKAFGYGHILVSCPIEDNGGDND